MPGNIRFSASASGTRNLFSPVTVASETHVFGMDPSTPANYLVPGNGSPAISTSAYYNTMGLYNFRPYDLDAMGSTGATVKAANGGKRYVWVCSADHPSTNGHSWVGGEGFYVGFSHQPWDFPKTLSEIHSLSLWGTYTSPQYGSGWQVYEFPRIIYNPDDPDGLPIYLLGEATFHHTGLMRTSDFVTFTFKELSHHYTLSNDWASFVRYAVRTGTNAFTTIALSNGNSPPVTNSIWTTTDGINYSTSKTPIVGLEGSADSAGSTFYVGCDLTAGGQLYFAGREDASGGGNNQHVTIWPVNASTFDKLSSPAKTRVASGWANTGFPGPTYLQDAPGFYEDGILYLWPTYGFPSDVNTTAGNAGRGGAPYSGGGGLDHQFLDKIVVRCNDAEARQSAPVGMAVSAASGTATITWKNALPQNTYRLYRGTDATTQATLIGDYSAVTSATDSPSTGRYWYKLVTLDNGTERKSRTLSVYVSSSSAFVNEHIDRVLDDGADSSTINRDFLDRADAMLDSVGIRNVLELMTHPACGVKTSTSPIKVYDLGTTRLPRSMDFKPTTANTSYSSTAVNGGPGWTNSTTSAYGYWGDLKRGNTIQKKRQITIIAAYERTQTTSDLTFVGTGPIWTNTIDGNEIIALKHTSGTPGTIEFSLSDETSTKTASVTASGSGLQIAIGTYDGTDMLAYTGSTAGSAVSTLDPNPDFGRTSGTPGYIHSSLAGARNYLASGTQNSSINGAFSFQKIIPFLGSGSVHCYTLLTQPGSGGVANDSTNFAETNAQGKFQCVMILEEALDATQIGDVISFLQSTADW